MNVPIFFSLLLFHCIYSLSIFYNIKFQCGPIFVKNPLNDIEIIRNLFLKKIYIFLQDMDTEEFNRHKQALSDKRLEKPKKLGSRCEKIGAEITSRRYNFKRDEIEVAALSELTSQDVLDFYDNFIEENAQNRRKLSTHVVSTAPNDSEGEEATTKEEEEKEMDAIESKCGQHLTDVNGFKSGLPLHPLVQSFIELKDLRRQDKDKLSDESGDLKINGDVP